MLTTNGGVGWVSLNSGLTDLTVQTLAASGGHLFAGTSRSGVFVSSNFGISWTAVNSGLTNLNVRTLAAAGTSLFAGTYGGGVFLSTDKGASWTAANSGLTRNYIFALAVTATEIFAGTSGGVFVTGDNGANWKPVDFGPTNAYVSSLAVCGTNIFVGTGGVHVSTDNGTAWTAVDSGMSRSQVLSFAVGGANLFAGTLSGVWRRPLSEMVTSVPGSGGTSPATVSLFQNYPNPFNPGTTIKYELPQTSMVTLSVFDILGRELSVLVNEKRDAGVHQVDFDGSGLSSGLYLYRLTACSVVQTKKFLLIR